MVISMIIGSPPLRPRLIAVIGLVFLAIGAPAEARHLHVYSPKTEAQGEMELSYWVDYFAETDLPLSGFSLERKGALRHSLEIEYGVTDRWTVALYGDWEDAPGGALEYVQTRLESIYRLFDPGSRMLDAALYLEYAVPRHNYEEHNELELKLLMERSAGPLVARLNPVVEQEISGEEGVELGYEAGLYAPTAAGITPGVELFGLFGPIREFDTRREQRHSIGPVLVAKLGEFKGEFGVQFGLTHGSDDVVAKAILSYAFEPH
ncbi:MAG: hypothetical protein AB1515_04205 [Nitrospirota bacterium]